MTSTADQRYNIKQGDTLPIFVEQLFNADGTPIDLTTATMIELEVKLVNGSSLTKSLGAGVEVVGNPQDGTIVCRWQQGDISVVGKHLQEVHVIFASGDDVHVPNDRVGYPFIVTRQAVVSP